jgi:hypothetical protein
MELLFIPSFCQHLKPTFPASDKQLSNQRDSLTVACAPERCVYLVGMNKELNSDLRHHPSDHVSSNIMPPGEIQDKHFNLL